MNINPASPISHAGFRTPLPVAGNGVADALTGPGTDHGSLPGTEQAPGGPKNGDKSAVGIGSASAGTGDKTGNGTSTDRNTTANGETSESRGRDRAGGPFGQNRLQELTPSELKEVQQLEKRDLEVRTHERSHVAAGGQHINGGISLQYQTGPDGNRYAVAGEVGIDTAPVAGDPAATERKMQAIQRAALAPANPSAQDRRVASKAAQLEIEARSEIIEMRREGGSTGEEGVSASDEGTSTSREGASEAEQGTSAPQEGVSAVEEGSSAPRENVNPLPPVRYNAGVSEKLRGGIIDIAV